jgi:hypothetical protein
MNSLKVIYDDRFVGICNFEDKSGKVFFQYSAAKYNFPTEKATIINAILNPKSK